MSVAKILEQRSHVVPGKLKVTEWFFEVPKDHSKPSAGSIRLFARSAEKVEKAADPKDEATHLPWFLYLQGGPGSGCRPPQTMPWSKAVLDKGYKLLMLDQRGTGMSSTVTAETLRRQGGAADQAAYLKHFRADSIVDDCEAVRKALTYDYPENKKAWSVLGQSFGGFCSVNYLSRFPAGLREVFTTGGLPPISVKQPDPVYERLVERIVQRSNEYYAKFPEDVQRVKDLAKHLTDNDIRTPSGGKLSVDRLRALGIYFGFHGGFVQVHDLILRMANDLVMCDGLTRPTIHAFDELGPFDIAVIYALLHEPLYCSGTSSNWSAERILQKSPAFQASYTDNNAPILFTAEMITRSMFRDYTELRPLLDTAELLFRDSDWPDLYDEAQLARNEVPVYSATFLDDIYVDFEFAQETARKIKGCKVFVTNTMYHDAIRSKTHEIMAELFAMRDDVID